MGDKVREGHPGPRGDRDEREERDASVRACSVALIPVLLAAVLLPAGPDLEAGGLPHLAGTLPGVEEAILKATQGSGLLKRVQRIEADTNGHLVIASIVLITPVKSPELLPSLHKDAWSLAATLFKAVPTLDELDLTAYSSGNSPFPQDGREAVFTAAIARGEFARLEKAGAGTAFARFPRVWFHPPLSHPQLAQRGFKVLTPSPEGYLEQRPAFWGMVQEEVEELRYRLSGWIRGGVVEGRLYRGDPRRRAMALTFDDGPVPLYTPLLLDTLDRLGLKATFFLVGERVAQYPYFAEAIVRAGHEVGNHTFHHVNLTRIPPEQVWEEIRKAQESIALATGKVPKYFRPPGGDYNARVIQVARKLGLITVFWTDNPGDYAKPDLQTLELKLFLRASNGGILLLHQGIPGTVHNLPVIVQILQRRRLGLTTVSGLLGP